ncbi:MAG TPA: CHAP domain-containing protein [Polyangiaceae bacterium]
MSSRFLFAAVALVGGLVASPAWAHTTADIASLALANVGKGACSTNSLGGHAFESSCTGNGGQPEYWCADFAQWVWANTGVGYTGELDAAAGSFYVYGQKHGTLHNSPAVGDAVVFDYQGGGVADHVAIVTKVDANGTIETVSGDWGGQSGTEAQFASTSSTVLNAPAYAGTVGSTPGVMGMTISGFIAPVGVSAGPPPLEASFVSQGSDAPKDPTGADYYRVCAGESFHFWFELKNTGSAHWTDTNDTAAGHWGKAVRLGVPGNKPDVFAGTARVSINENANADVDPAGGNCANKSGCDSTRFTTAGIAGTAPAKAGTYKTTWQLVDEQRAWFGPTMWLSFDVVACPHDAGAAEAGSGSGGGSADGGAPVAAGGEDGGASGATSEAGDPASSDAPTDGSGGCSVQRGTAGGEESVACLVGVALLVLGRGRRRRRQP